MGVGGGVMETQDQPSRCNWTKRAEEILTGFKVPIWDGTVGMLAAELKGIYREGEVMGHCPCCIGGANSEYPFPGCGHEAEIAKLQKQVQMQADEITYLSGELDTERHRVEQLQEKLADLLNAIQGAMDPAPDEEHCACVPLLRAEIARLQGELRTAQARLAVIASGILPDGDHVPLPVQVYAQEQL